MNATNLLWKATRPDGTTRGGVRWAVGETVTHPTSTAMVRDDPATYLSCSAEPAETLIGGSWPCRLFQVQPLGEVIDSDRFLHKRCILSGLVVAEVEPWRALGPNGRQVAALIDRAGHLADVEARRLSATWVAARNAAGTVAWHAARNAAGEAAWRAAWRAVWVAARDAARVAARVAVVRDLITAEQYELLAGPLESVVGPIEALPVPAWVDAPGRVNTRG